MRAFSFLFLIALLAVLGVLAYENNYSTPVSAWNWRWEVPFPGVIGVVYVLGMLTGGALVSAVKRSWYRVTEPDRA